MGKLASRKKKTDRSEWEPILRKMSYRQGGRGRIGKCNLLRGEKLGQKCVRNGSSKSTPKGEGMNGERGKTACFLLAEKKGGRV